jgi:hypothetical protein
MVVFRSIIGFVVFFFITAVSYSQAIVFQGAPFVKNSSSHEETANEKLEGPGQVMHKLTIIKEDDSYYWGSRDKKPLEYKKNGSFHYFYDPLGASYIKIFKAEEGKYLYLEHVSLGFKTISYWGGGSKLELSN